MDLNGALSNPQVPLEGCADRLMAIRNRRSLSNGLAPAVVPPRPGRVARAVRTILQHAGAAMQVRAIHRACEELLEEPVNFSTVKDCLSEHSQGSHPWFVRVVLGVYAIRGPSNRE
jgi:hypothetical protein